MRWFSGLQGGGGHLDGGLWLQAGWGPLKDLGTAGGPG